MQVIQNPQVISGTTLTCHSINNLVWYHCPETVFCDIKVVCFVAYDAILCFREGSGDR
jgi:hypothetical protein